MTLRSRCKICGRLLNYDKSIITDRDDCGGDCLRCMAEVADDPDCIDALRKLEAEVAQREQIVAAAIRHNEAARSFGGLTITVPKPGRHSDILRDVFALNPQLSLGCEQGFITSKGRFVDRLTASAIAIGAKQVTKELLIAGPYLYSEDLW